MVTLHGCFTSTTMPFARRPLPEGSGTFNQTTFSKFIQPARENKFGLQIVQFWTETFSSQENNTDWRFATPGECCNRGEEACDCPSFGPLPTSPPTFAWSSHPSRKRKMMCRTLVLDRSAPLANIINYSTNNESYGRSPETRRGRRSQAAHTPSPPAPNKNNLKKNKKEKRNAVKSPPPIHLRRRVEVLAVNGGAALDLTIRF